MKEEIFVKFWKNGNDICFECSNGYSGADPIKNGNVVETFNNALSHVEKLFKVKYKD